jgi:hypothetical protein
MNTTGKEMGGWSKKYSYRLHSCLERRLVVFPRTEHLLSHPSQLVEPLRLVVTKRRVRLIHELCEHAVQPSKQRLLARLYCARASVDAILPRAAEITQQRTDFGNFGLLSVELLVL